MSIVLEGPDNSGKSTVAKKLNDIFGWPILHAGGPATKEDVDVRLATDLANMTLKDRIMDRSCIISESIYGPICRDTSLFDATEWYKKIQALDMLDPDLLIVFCVADSEHLLNDTRDQSDKEHKSKEHQQRVQEMQYKLIQRYQVTINAFQVFTNCVVIDPRQGLQPFINHVQEWKDAKK